MEQKDFFTMPHALIDSGLWARMKPSDKAVYTVLARFANYKTRYCFPSFDTICTHAGMSKTHVSQSIQRLVIYGLIRKKRAPKGLKFRNIYTVLQNPKIDISTCPQKMDKKCKPKNRDRTGKFRVHPQNMDTDTCPQIMDEVHPQNMDKKERQEIERNRDSFKTPSPLISLRTIITFLQEKGEDFVVQILKSHGLTEDQIKTSLKEAKNLSRHQDPDASETLMETRQSDG